MGKPHENHRLYTTGNTSCEKNKTLCGLAETHSTQFSTDNEKGVTHSVLCYICLTHCIMPHCIIVPVGKYLIVQLGHREDNVSRCFQSQNFLFDSQLKDDPEGGNRWSTVNWWKFGRFFYLSQNNQARITKKLNITPQDSNPSVPTCEFQVKNCCFTHPRATPKNGNPQGHSVQPWPRPARVSTAVFNII